MSVVHFSSLVALASLSGFHLILTPIMFDAWSARVVWYIGIDLAVAAIIALNVVVARIRPIADPTSWRICHTINGANLVFVAIYAIVVPDPGTAAAAIVDVALFIGAFLTRARLARSETASLKAPNMPIRH